MKLTIIKMGINKKSWTSMVVPNGLSVKSGSNEFTSSILNIEPLERGFGVTLGNSLRRVMLSSIYGFAVTSVKIDGVSHEFETLDGVKEDVADILMNIKLLAIKKEDSGPCSLKLICNSAGQVMAGSIKTPEDVEIINKDLVICTVNEGFSINITMNVECGKGYVSADSINTKLAIGYIAIDAIFNPIKRVSYKVEDARVDHVTDYDKLVLDIETNGTISPSDAVATASRIIQNHTSVFINFDEEVFESVVESEDKGDVFDTNLLKSIDELELSVRSYNCLKNENILYIGDLITKTEAEMLKTANFGRKSLNELRDNLRVMNLKFGTSIAGWPPANIETLKKEISN
ncbi:DNA-directed RNA polymerase subunit alpha [Flavobacteriaceae bacterium]|nr:DNA-directed RNA polymerase subunit alpha [Flavobacteriaceae bacterium]